MNEEPLSSREAAKDKEGLRNIFLDDIFSTLIKKDAKGNDLYSLEIDIGEKAAKGQQRLKVTLFLDAVLELTLRELVVVGVVSKYALKTRRRAKGRVVVAVVTLIPQRFYEWYYEEEFGFKVMATFLAFHRRLAKQLKSATAAVYYLQIYDWYQDEKKDAEGYITKRRKDIQKATGLTLSEVVSSKALLKRKHWLNVWEGNRHGIKVNRFKPLKRISMSKKNADALRQRFWKRSEKISELDGLLAGLERGLDYLKDTLDSSVVWRLRKYAKPGTLELPEFNGKGPSEWAKRADQIIATDEFIQYHGNVDAAERDYEKCRKMHFDSIELSKKIKAMRKDVLASLNAMK